MLQNGTSATAAGKKAVKTLERIGKEFNLDSTILLTLPITCKKAPAARSDFEKSVFTNVEALLNSEISTAAGSVNEAEPAKAAKTTTTANAAEALEKARGDLKAATETLDAAHSSVSETNKNVRKADAFLRHIWADMKQVCDAQDKIAGE